MANCPDDTIATLQRWHRVLLLAHSTTQTVRSFEKDAIHPDCLNLLEVLQFELREVLFPNALHPNHVRNARPPAAEQEQAG